jgi:hypothetical protein
MRLKIIRNIEYLTFGERYQEVVRWRKPMTLGSDVLGEAENLK